MNDLLKNLNRRFDHAALKSDVDDKTIARICDEAKTHGFFSVAVNPVWVVLASEKLSGTDVKILSTAGFPLGANRTDIKVAESTKAVSDGAHEIDMVANIGWIKSGELNKVEKEISEIRNSVPFNVILKVIIEASLLTRDEQTGATSAVINGGAQFVKTGTGFLGAATVEQVEILVKAAENRIEVKASGGIRSLKQCREFLEAGASRLGSSACVQIMRELESSPK